MTHTGISQNNEAIRIPRVKLNRSIPINVSYLAPSGEYTTRSFDMWFAYSRESLNRLISWAMLNNIELRINSAVEHTTEA